MKARTVRDKSRGQSIAEWGLIIALISVVTIAVLTQIGTSLNTMTNEVNTALNSVSVNTST